MLPRPNAGHHLNNETENIRHWSCICLEYVKHQEILELNTVRAYPAT